MPFPVVYPMGSSTGIDNADCLLITCYTYTGEMIAADNVICQRPVFLDGCYNYLESLVAFL